MKKDIIIITIAAVIMLSLVMVIRTPDTLAGEEAYSHLFTAQSGEASRLTIGEAPVISSQYDYFLKFSFLFFEPSVFMKIFPIILGALSVILFYLIIKKFVKEKSALYASLIFILSPTFIFIFSTNSAEIISLFLLLLGVAMLINKKQYFSSLSIIPFIFASISSLFIGLLIPLIYLTYFLIKKEKRFDFIIGIIIIILIVVLEKPKFIINYTLTQLPLTANLFSDFGGLLGISIFTAIFAIAGLIVSKKREYFYPIIIYLIIAFLIDYRTIIYGSVLICAFAGIGLKTIIEKKWKLNDLKQTMNFLMVCGLLFSTVSHIGLLRDLAPSQELAEASIWLNENSDINSIVLSKPSNAYVLEYFSKRTVVFDPLSIYSEGFSDILNDSKEIYYSRNLEETEKLLNKYNISYILVDTEMTEGEIWKRPHEGLLFLFTNQEKFPVVYNKGGIKIIYYIK